MKKYNSWGYKEQEEYEAQLKIIYSKSWRDGLESAKVDQPAKYSIYGEVTHRGVENILAAGRQYFDDPNGVFYDLGSGTGKLISHVALAGHVTVVP